MGAPRSPETRAKISAAMRARHADPAFRARMVEVWTSPEFRATAAENMRRLNADTDFAARLKERGRERMRRLHARPDFAAARNARLAAMNASPEHRAAASERMRAQRRTPAFLERLSAARRRDDVEELQAPTSSEAKRIAAGLIGRGYRRVARLCRPGDFTVSSSAGGFRLAWRLLESAE